MRAFINIEDNSVAFLEYNGEVIHPSFWTLDHIKFVEVPDSCFENVPEDEYNSMLYDEESNRLIRHPSYAPNESERGKAIIRSELIRYSLIPITARNENFNITLQTAYAYLPAEEVEAILADNVLDDAEIQTILGYLNSDS